MINLGRMGGGSGVTRPMAGPPGVMRPMGAPAPAPAAPAPAGSTTAPAPVPAPAPAAVPPPQNHPVDVIGAPASAPTPAPAPAPTPASAPPQGFGFGHGGAGGFNGVGGGFEDRMKATLQKRIGNNPGFLDRLQSMLASGHGMAGMLQRRDPGFDWAGFIHGLGGNAATPPVGAGATPAPTVGMVPGVTGSMGTNPAAANGPSSFAPPAIPTANFNPLNLNLGG